MNNEIKEILENIKCPQLGYDEYGKWGALPLNVRMTLKRLCDYVVSCDDYITNLQQIEQDHKETNARLMSELAKLEEENERLKEQANENKVIVEYTIKPSFTTRKLNDYKSRCEKAIEYIRSTTFFGLRSGKTFMSKYLNDLLNILQNEIKGE